MPPIGRDLKHRIEHKPPPMHLGVGERYSTAEHEVVIGNEVEIEHTRSPFAPTFPPEHRLDAMQLVQQFDRTKFGRRPHRSVDIAALLRPERCSAIEAGNSFDRHHFRQRYNRRAEYSRRVAVSAMPPVRAECDDDGRLHVRGAGLDGSAMSVNPDPPRDCPLCPRLVGYRERLRIEKPDWYNAPVEGWGDPEAWLLVVGLAPGVSGANRTGRPFTGDYAGVLLYETLAKFGFTRGTFGASADDGMTLDGVFIANAAACVPPENKPLPVEVKTCRPFLEARIASLPNLRTVVALGAISHQSTVKAFGGKLPKHPFGHGNRHDLKAGVTLFDSYHCSRYNTNTGRLTVAMFEDVFRMASETRL